MADPGKIEFVPETVLKRDHFSETVVGYDAGSPSRRLAMRRLSNVPWWTRWLAWILARREIAGLRAVRGLEGAPVLLRVDADGILRSWADGVPLNRSRPSGPMYYKDARRILRQLRQCGVAHNDLAKPQNWLVTPEGRAAVIDFQLASLHPRRGWLFRALAYEDLRHLLKQKRKYAAAELTARERRILARRAWPSRVWMATAKPIYVFVTRRLMRWSDGEGAGNRLQREGPEIRAALLAVPGVRDVVLLPYPRAAKGMGLYAFVEADEKVPQVSPAADLVQIVAQLPRRGDGSLRDDVLDLVATNRMADLDALCAAEPGLRGEIGPLIAGRRNLTDR